MLGGLVFGAVQLKNSDVKRKSTKDLIPIENSNWFKKLKVKN